MRVVDGVESRARLFSVNKTRGIVSNAGRGFCVGLRGDNAAPTQIST